MSSKVRAVARPSRRTLANQREENDAMRRWKMPLVSLGLFLTGVAAYLLAAGFFGLFFLGVLNRDGNAIAAVPYSILAGMILNGLGVIAAIAGFFLRAERKWACVILMALNAAPPLLAFGLMALGFILIG